MDLISTITDDWGRLFSLIGVVIGVVALINTCIIKKKQIKEIEAAKEVAIFKSDMPRAAIIEKPNDAGVGIVLLQFESISDLLNYTNDNPNCKVVTSQYGGDEPYNKIEVLRLKYKH